MEANPGDYVEIDTGKQKHTGILMPRPTLAEGDDIILKLDSGYNIGLSRKNVKSVKKLQKTRQLENFPIRKAQKNPKLPSISFLGCGGTIASRVDYETGGVKSAKSPEEIFFTVPELKEICNLADVGLITDKFSESMSPEDWVKMAKASEKAINSGSEGVVLMHGTDTMHFSSAALSFMLKDLEKPVVFTGSQRSSDRGSSDAPINIICSAHIAAKADFSGVGICMHGSPSDDFCYLHRGTKVRKMHTSRRDAFQSVNDKPLLKVFPDGKIEKPSKTPGRGEGKCTADTRFEEKTALIKTYPGAKPDIMDYYVSKGYKGLVIEATGLGQVPDTWQPAIKNAIDSDVVVVFAPQTLYGRLNPYVYEPARKCLKMGVIYAGDMLPEVAYVKLGCILGRSLNPEEMTKNWAGEITQRTGKDFEPGF